MANDDCLFCAIASGKVPAELVRQTEKTVTFRDIDPQAPAHLLVIPRQHYQDLTDLTAGDPLLAGELLREVAEAAKASGVSQYRAVLNTGAEAGQSVFHVHAHMLGGRRMTWPPG